jgi:hypothetical protein
MLGFQLAENISPKLNREDNAGYLALFIRDVLYLEIIHGEWRSLYLLAV